MKKKRTTVKKNKKLLCEHDSINKLLKTESKVIQRFVRTEY